MNVALKQFLAEGRLKPHRASLKEIRDLLRVVDRDLKDARVTAISFDRQFITAYQAAFQLATIVLAASGFRTTGTGHHWVTFRVLPELMGRDVQDLADYFDQCRIKRNPTDYDRAGEISGDEARELLGEAKKFRSTVLNWLKTQRPKLFPR